MKLITKTSLNFISATIFFFLFGILGGYYFIRYSMNKYLNHQLFEAKKDVDSHLRHSKHRVVLSYADVLIDTLDLKSRSANQVTYIDTVIYNSKGEMDLYRQLNYNTMVNGLNYRIRIRKSTAPNDMQIMKFTFMLATFPILFFCILFFVNRNSVKRSLTVFYDTIDKLKTFDVNKDNNLELLSTDVDEFNKLNKVFDAMEAKIKEDFVRLKEYTENTSHELQTPLAILSSKLDELLQSPNLEPKQIETIAGLIDTTSRISRINQALIFLAKIDNRMFEQIERLNTNDLINSMLQSLEVLWEDRNLKVETEFKNQLIVNVNPNLIQTLLQNLIKNAILHNEDGGYIHIDISKHKLIITNSGEPLEFEPNEAFSRYKRKQHHLSMGIGLSVVKRIAEVSNIDIEYQNQDRSHQITLNFSNVVIVKNEN